MRIFLVHFGNFFHHVHACEPMHTLSHSACSHILSQRRRWPSCQGALSSPTMGHPPPLPLRQSVLPAPPVLSGKCVVGRGTLSWNSSLTSLLHSPRGFSDCVQDWVQGAWLGLLSDSQKVSPSQGCSCCRSMTLWPREQGPEPAKAGLAGV